MSPDWLDAIDMAAVRRVALHPSDNFVELAKMAKLDPARDFRHLNLSKVDFAGCRLAGYDFRGSILVGASFRGASIAGAIFDGRQLELPELVGARDFGAVFQRPSVPMQSLSADELKLRLLNAGPANDIEAIRQAVAAGADIEDEVFIGTAHRTPLTHLAARTAMNRHHGVLGAQFLLRAGADPNHVLLPDRWSPLLEAVAQQNFGLVKLLLQSGADPNAASLDGRSPLGIARAQGARRITSLLAEFGATNASHLE